MTDIVERLRDINAPLMQDAADEIERLRAVLAAIALNAAAALEKSPPGD